MTAPVEPVGFPYVHYHHGERVTFIENPDDYIGQHRYHVDPVLTVDPLESVAPLAADDNWSIGADYSPRHAIREPVK